MKNFVKFLGTCVASVCLLITFAHAQSVPTVISHQGRLTDASGPVNGTYDFELTLYDSPTGGSSVGLGTFHYNTPVVDGLFTLEANFDSVDYSEEVYLQILARESGTSTFGNPLMPRVPIRAVPVASTTQSIQGISVSTDDPNNGDLLIYNHAEREYEPVPIPLSAIPDRFKYNTFFQVTSGPPTFEFVSGNRNTEVRSFAGSGTPTTYALFPGFSEEMEIEDITITVFENGGLAPVTMNVTAEVYNYITGTAVETITTSATDIRFAGPGSVISLPLDSNLTTVSTGHYVVVRADSAGDASNFVSFTIEMTTVATN